MSHPRKSFARIVLQSKDDRSDWRAFLHARLGEECWELRASGQTPEEAAAAAWRLYQLDPVEWAFYGYVVERFGD